MNRKFFGSASVVTSAGCFVLEREHWVCVDGHRSTLPMVGIVIPVIISNNASWLISCRRSCTRHVHPSIWLSSAVRNHPGFAASAVEHCNMRYTWRRIILRKDLRCQSGSWRAESLLLSKPNGCVIRTGDTATSRSRTRRFSRSAMAISISPLRHLPVLIVVLLS